MKIRHALMALPLLALGLTACDPGPACEQHEWHTSWVYVWSGKTMSPHMVTSYDCVRYATESPKP